MQFGKPVHFAVFVVGTPSLPTAQSERRGPPPEAEAAAAKSAGQRPTLRTLFLFSSMFVFQLSFSA